MRTTWNLINIKARKNQTPAHYIEALTRLKQQDPLIEVAKDRCISILGITKSSEESRGIPSWLIIKLIAYTIIDPNNFYNRRSREDIEMAWDSDVVANKKDAEIFFVPSNHTIAVSRSSKITYRQIQKYFELGLNAIEPDGFDVNTIISKDIINRIKDAHAIIRLQADISFSNPGHTGSFKALFDEKVRETNPDKLNITLEGTRTTPLSNESDGLIPAITDMAERDGSIEATIQEEEGGKYEKINSAQHPRILSVNHMTKANYWGDLFNAISNIFRS